MFEAKYIPIIKQEVDRIRKQYGYSEDSPIGDYIFTILKNECTLVEWPEEGQLDLDGFSILKTINNRTSYVVYINTAKNKEKQNFCAAHELGHRYGIETLLRDAFPEDVISLSTVEHIMNRFAAELMMPQNAFKEKGEELLEECRQKVENGRRLVYVKDLIDAVIQLMDFYYVPYKAVIIRLKETGLISAECCAQMEQYEGTEEGKSIVEALIVESGITRLRAPDSKIQFSIPIDNIENIIKDPQIAKYISDSELDEYLKNMGMLEEDLDFVWDMKKIENATLAIDN